MSKQRFIVHCTTNWCGMDNDYPVLTDDEYNINLDDFAYDNLMSYMSLDELAEDLGIYEENYETFEDYERERDNIDIMQYCNAHIEPFEGTDEEWNEMINYIGLQIF